MDCAFCERRNLEERLIAENEHFYLVATLGQITDGGYTLIIPKRHVPCIGAMDEVEIEKLAKFKEQVCRITSLEYKKPITIFEHGIVGQTVKHAHLHILPHFINLTYRVGALDFPNAPMENLDLKSLAETYKDHSQPYLFWHNLFGRPAVCWNPPAPAQYLRIVAAESLGRPERANWRNMDPELDKKLWSETVKRLKVYFPGSP